MTLAQLRTRGALRSLAGKPVWLLIGTVMLGAIGWLGYRGVKGGVDWILAFPDIGTIAPAVIQRSLEGLLLMVMVAVLFSVLVASIGILYGSSDLELLLSQPVPGARVFTVKTAELFLNTAGLPVALTLPVLAGIGHAMGAHPLYYPVSLLAVASLCALPVTLGSLLALVLMRLAPAGRVREVATAVSVAFAAVAVLGFRLLRPERISEIAAMSPEEFEVILTGFAQLELGWLPPAWAANAAWAAIDGGWHAATFVLPLVALGSLGVTALLARHAYERGWVRNLDSVPEPRRASRGGAEPPRWERFLARRLGTVGVILVKDLRIFFRDVSQWSQLLVLVALGGVYFVSLSAIPVPTQQFRDVLGALNIGFISFVTAGVALRIAYPGVSLEGGSYWFTQVSPLHKRQLVVSRFLLALPVMLALGLGLGFASGAALDLSPILAVAAQLAGAASSLAMTGLAVGLGAAFPKFDFGDVNEISATPGAMTFMALALVHTLITVVLFARPAWMALRSPFSGGGYWGSGEGLLVLAIVALLTLVTTLVPLVIGARQLERAELH